MVDISKREQVNICRVKQLELPKPTEKTENTAPISIGAFEDTFFIDDGTKYKANLKVAFKSSLIGIIMITYF